MVTHRQQQWQQQKRPQQWEQQKWQQWEQQQLQLPPHYYNTNWCHQVQWLHHPHSAAQTVGLYTGAVAELCRVCSAVP